MSKVKPNHYFYIIKFNINLLLTHSFINLSQRNISNWRKTFEFTQKLGDFEKQVQIGLKNMILSKQLSSQFEGTKELFEEISQQNFFNDTLNKNHQALSTLNQKKQLVIEKYINNMSNQVFKFSQISNNKIHEQQIRKQFFSKDTNMMEVEMIQKLLKKDFFLSNQNNGQNKKFFVQLIRQNNQFGVVDIFCGIGKFAKKYTILNLCSESWRHNSNKLGCGTFGSVFSCQCSSQGQTAIKCVKFQIHEIDVIKNSLKQFFFADIMAALEIGPQILRSSQFDLIIFQDCLEFQMECCLQSQLKTVEQDLKLSLLKMHLLKMVHSDIKPHNLGYSRIFKKNVFLDFGTADLLKEEIWQSTNTKFKGTYEFCGDQMKKKYSLKNGFSKINLYLNDIHMLTKSLQSLQSNYEFDKILLPKVMKKQQINYNFQKQVLVKINHLLHSYDSRICQNYQVSKLIVELNNMKISYNNQKAYSFEIIKNSLEQCKLLESQQIVNSHIKINNIFENIRKIFNNLINLYDQKLNKVQSQEKLLIFYKQLQYSCENSLNQQPDKTQNQLNNLQFILTNLQILQNLCKEDFITQVILHVSFAKGSKQTPIKKKQAVAFLFRKIYEPQIIKQNLQDKMYFHEKYLPQQPFVTNQCQNLVWIYSYLMTWCMRGEMSKMKAQQLIILIKDSIFLSFKYPLLLEECFKKYLVYLIESQSQILITETVLRTLQILQLATKHFLYSSKMQCFNKDSYLRLLFKNIFNDLFSEQKIPEKHNQMLRRKFKLLSSFSLLVDAKLEKQCFYEQVETAFEETIRYVKDLITQIQCEFCHHKQSFAGFNYFEEAIRLIYMTMLYLYPLETTLPTSFLLSSLSQSNINSQKKINVSHLIESKLNHTRLFMISTILHLESFINCEEIAFYFILFQKFALHYQYQNTETVRKILSIIFDEKLNFVLMNFNLCLKIIKENKNFEFNYSNHGYSDYLVKDKQLSLSLLSYFASAQQLHLSQILLSLITIKTTQPSFEKLFPFLYTKWKQYVQVCFRIFERILDEKGLHIVLFHTALNIITLLFEFDFQNFLKFRLHFYEIILKENIEYDATMKQIINLQNLQQKNHNINQINKSQKQNRFQELITGKMKQGRRYKSIKDLINYQCNMLIFSDIFKEYQGTQIKYDNVIFQDYQSQLVKMNIIKLKLCIYSQFNLFEHITMIDQQLIFQKKYLELIQLLVQFNIESNHSQSFLFTQLLLDRLFLMKKLLKNIESNQVLKMIQFMEALQVEYRKIITSTILVPIYAFVIDNQQFMIKQNKKFATILAKIYLSLPAFFSLNVQSHHPLISPQSSIGQVFSVHLLLLSLKFLENKQAHQLINPFKKRRKINLMIRFLIKNLRETDKQQVGEMKRYIDLFIYELIPERKNIGERCMLNLYCESTIKNVHQVYLKCTKTMFINSFKFPSSQFLLKKQNTLSDTFNSLYQTFFSGKENTQPSNVYKKPKSHYQTYSVQFKQSSQMVSKIKQIRNKLLSLQYQRLSNKLLKKKGKIIQEISWLKVANQ